MSARLPIDGLLFYSGGKTRSWLFGYQITFSMYVGEIVVDYLIIFHKLLFIGVQQNKMNTHQLNSKCNHVKWWCGLAIHCKESSASNGLNKEMSWKSAAIIPGKDKKKEKERKKKIAVIIPGRALTPIVTIYFQLNSGVFYIFTKTNHLHFPNGRSAHQCK